MGAPAPAKQGKGPVFWVLMGCCGCLLLVLLGLGGLVGLVYTQTQPAASAVLAMLKDAKSSQFDQAYLRCSEGFRARVSREEFEALVSSHPALRQNADASFMKRSNTNGVVVFEDATLVSDSKEQESVSFRVVQEGGEWKIDDITFGAGGPSTSSSSTRPPPTTAPSAFPGSGSLTLSLGTVRKVRDGEAIKVEINLEVSGFQTQPHDSGARPDLVEDVETRGPDGRRIASLSKENIERFQEAAETSHTFTTTLTVDPNNPPGTYRVLLTVHDMIGGSKASQEVTFELP